VSSKSKPLTDWLGKRLIADAARVAATSKDRYTIQLMNADQRAQPAIEVFLRTAGRELNPDLIMMFPTGTASNPRVTVLYGNFDGPADAAAVLGALPASVSRFRPYARSFGVVLSGARPGSAEPQ
jgi:septal ring-binding cell division protein DamX